MAAAFWRNAFALLAGSSIVLTAAGFLFMKPILFAFGASEASFVYAREYLNIYFFGFVFMALQFAGQTVFQALGDARHAIFFSLLRKAVIVVPLTLLLPRLGFGVLGVFMAEPVSNVIGGLACYLTMRATACKKIDDAINGSA